MNIKKILFILSSIFLMFQSYKLIETIDMVKGQSWITVIIVAWLVNLFITGIFAFLGFALPTQKLLPRSYYQIKNPKRLTWIYNLFKVEFFKKFLLLTFWRNKKQRKKYFNGKLNGLQNFMTQTQKSEFGHLIPFIIICFLCLFFLQKNLLKLALVTFIINWIGNGYPIILQRHHRIRLSKLYEKLKLRQHKRRTS